MTGSANKSTNLITAAAQGDLDEVQMLLQSDTGKTDKTTKQKMDINKGDYDKRTALHLAYVNHRVGRRLFHIVIFDGHDSLLTNKI